MLSTLIRQSVAPLVPQRFRPWTVLRGGAREFERKIAVDFTVRGYRVKTVETKEELKDVLALRRSVFHYEFAKKWVSLKSDQDEFDELADHLAIVDQEEGRVVGVYRLIPSTSSRHFYSSTEFDISGFLARPGTKLELSRACIDRDHRNGIVISLLWRGLAEYAKKAGIDFLFGLSSITTSDVNEIAGLHRYFETRGMVDDNYGITPKSRYRIPDLPTALNSAPPVAAGTVPAVPPLFKTYLKAGAKICSQPVIDRDFNCADWLTVLNMASLAATFDRKYMQE